MNKITLVGREAARRLGKTSNTLKYYKNLGNPAKMDAWTLAFCRKRYYN